jgi:uncharacterized SAM-binding protein YcdF (DUF218 family)
VLDEILFVARKIATALVLPPVGPLLLAAAGLFLIRRGARLGYWPAWTGVLVLLALSMPFVAHWLTVAAADTEPLDLARARDAEAIVILGGGLRRNAREYGGDTLGALSLERVRYGARLAKQLGLPVLVSGGVAWGETAEADVLAEVIERELGVPVRWRETQSRDTRGNAHYSAKLLSDAGITRIVLVGHSFDLPRSRAEFEANGMQVVPAPTVLPAVRLDSPMDYMPSMGALARSYYALYELLADFVRGFRQLVSGASPPPRAGKHPVAR